MERRHLAVRAPDKLRIWGISQRQKCIAMYTTVQVRSEFGKFAYTAICIRNVYTLI
jgi:hypothetical protein